jgi:hypothetical protein
VFGEEDHLFNKDGKIWTCPACGARVFWTNLVDQTNGSFDEEGDSIDGFVKLIRKEPDVDSNKLALVQSLAKLLDLRITIIVKDTYIVSSSDRGTFYDDQGNVIFHNGDSIEDKDKDQYLPIG